MKIIRMLGMFFLLVLNICFLVRCRVFLMEVVVLFMNGKFLMVVVMVELL